MEAQNGDVIRFDHHDTGEEISGIVVGQTAEGNLRLKLHKERTGETTWFCTPNEVKDIIGEVTNKDNLRQMGRVNVQFAIEDAEEENESEEADGEPESEDDEMVSLPTHPLKRIGEIKRREKEDVCSKCGCDLREYDGGYICPTCITRGDPELCEKRSWMDTSELVAIKN